MFYEKRYSVDSPKRKKYRLSSFAGYDVKKRSSSLPRDWCEETFNFAFSDGELTQGAGFEPFVRTFADGTSAKLPALETLALRDTMFAGKLTFDGVPRDCLFVSDATSLKYIVLDDADAQWQTCEGSIGKHTNAVHYLHDGDDLMLFAGIAYGVFVMSGTGGTFVADALPIRDVCTYNERVFAVVDSDRPCVWFSDTFDPYNWNVSLDEGGYIYTDGAAGKVLRVIAMGDYAYVFCEYGVYRLSGYADQTEFTLKRLSCDCGRIFGGSIVNCADAIVFSAIDGIYATDGYTVYKMTDRADKLLSGAKDVSAVCWRNVYCATFTDEGESVFGHDAHGEEGNAIFALDLDSGNIDVYRGVRVRSLTVLRGSADNKLIARSKDSGEVLQVCDGGAPVYTSALRYWGVSGIDFGAPCDKKLIVSAECRVSAPTVLGVIADGVTTEHLVTPSRGVARINRSGYEFGFYIMSRAPRVRVRPPVLTVDTVRGDML